MRRVLKLIAFLTVTLVLGTAVSVLAVYHLVRAGEVHRYLTDEIEKRTELRVKLDGADLEFGWITGIAFSNLALFEPGAAGPAITAEHVTARLALLPLLRRQVIFYEIRLQQPAARLVRDAEGRVPLLDKLLNLQFIKDRTGELSLDLRSVKIKDGNFAMIDDQRKRGLGEWHLVNVDLDVERLRGNPLSQLLNRRATTEPEAAALAFELEGAVVRDGGRIGVKAQGQLAFPEKTPEFHRAYWNGDIDVVNLPAALIADYLAPHLPVKSMAGYLAQRIHVEGSAQTLLRVKGVLEFRQLAIDAPEVFLAPLNGLDGRATFVLDRTPQQVRISQAHIHSRDINASLQGSVSALDSDDPRMRGSVAVMRAPALTLLRYLPVRLAGSAQLENAVKMVEAGELEILKADVDATFKQLRGERGSTAKLVSLQAELRDFAGTPTAIGALPLRSVSGKIAMANGVLAFKNFHGSYGGSRFYDAGGSYDIAGPVPGKLEMQAAGEIAIAELKQQIEAQPVSPTVGRFVSSVQELSGRGKINLALTRAPNTPIQFDGKAFLERAHMRFDDISISDLQGEIAFTPAEIKGERIGALLGGSPVEIRLALKDYSSDDGNFDVSMASPGIKAGVISSWLLAGGNARADGLVRGSVRYAGPFKDRNRRVFTGDLDLQNVQLLVSPLLQPLRELNGNIKIDEAGIDFQSLRGLLVGVPASASGRWRYGASPQLRFDFAAPSLDITYLISQIDSESSEFYANLVAEGNITLGKGRIKNFDFNDLSTRARIDRRVWRLTDLAAKSAGGTVQGATTIFDKPDTLAIVSEPKVQGVPVQSFLKWFDITNTEMTGKVSLGGKLETAGKNDFERKRNLNGAFNMRIEDGTINRMRILVQILNLLDLSRWFSLQFPDLAKEGIRFRAVTGDFKVVNGVYATENLVVDSNDLRMTGAGKIDVPRNELDFVVAVRPFAGIDTALSYIPLLGRGVAAIKNSILVASFNIQGPIDNPTITPAPLDTVAGWFWGVLGIPKNMIGLGEGEKKAEPAQPGKNPAP